MSTPAWTVLFEDDEACQRLSEEVQQSGVVVASCSHEVSVNVARDDHRLVIGKTAGFFERVLAVAGETAARIVWAVESNSEVNHLPGLRISWPPNNGVLAAVRTDEIGLRAKGSQLQTAADLEPLARLRLVLSDCLRTVCGRLESNSPNAQAALATAELNALSQILPDQPEQLVKLDGEIWLTRCRIWLATIAQAREQGDYSPPSAVRFAGPEPLTARQGAFTVHAMLSLLALAPGEVFQVLSDGNPPLPAWSAALEDGLKTVFGATPAQIGTVQQAIAELKHDSQGPGNV